MTRRLRPRRLPAPSRALVAAAARGFSASLGYDDQNVVEVGGTVPPSGLNPGPGVNLVKPSCTNCGCPATDPEVLASLPEPKTLKMLDQTWELIWKRADVTTMEKKYGVVRWAAEFWSTVTSIFFASPVLIYFIFPAELLPPITHFCVCCSVVTATTSAVYHCTLYKIFSSCDAAVATVMFWMNAYGLMTEVRGFGGHAVWSSPWFWWLTVGCLALFFVWSWKTTAKAAVRLMGLVVPVAVRGYVHLECYSGLLLGSAGILFFLLDRKRVAASHALWHVFGGLCLLFTSIDVAKSYMGQQA